ncbi:MAG TPA: S53 family peptidase [Solirubrobacteraceae bacterium]|nr:S53 family peptidase [Solirubrobacteraceae bacterium]
MTKVAQGVNPASLPGSTVFGDTPANTPETVSFVLRAQNLGQLESAVTNGVSHFLSVGQFASIYGQDPSTIAALRSYLAGFGIKTASYPDNIDVVANGTAGEFDKALAIQQHQYRVPGYGGHGGLRGLRAQTVHGSPQSPELPASLARSVLAVLGLTNYSSMVSNAVHADQEILHPQSSSTQQCIAETGLPLACNTPEDFASDYNLNGLYRRGATGQGRTVAIVTLAALDPGAPQFFWKNILGIKPSGRTVTTVNVDGGPGAPSDASGTGETDLDAEQSGALAPGANVIVYQAPNTDPGFFDGFAQAASDNTADSVSTSWGESEVVVKELVASGTETPAYQAAFDEVFLEMAAQGQSAFDASGDEAAYDDYDELGTTGLAVDTNSDSPYITAAGGTTLPFSGTVSSPDGSITAPITSGRSERAWGWDYTWLPESKVLGEPLATVAEDPINGVGGDGGGFSSDEPQPSYQRGVPGTNAFSAVKYFTSTDVQDIGGGVFEPTGFAFDPNPPVVHGFGSGRASPDVSTDADPLSGYLLYEPSFAGVNQPVLQPDWGGTSFVAPQLNGSTAVIDSYVGHRVGFWNPSIYQFATQRNSPFDPLNTTGTNNDNLFYTGTPGTVFNPSSGLGTPDFAALGNAFAAQH